jgi:hypothetical protein
MQGVNGLTAQGKLGELIKQKRSFLQASTKDYSSGGNDMLDDLEAGIEEAKMEIIHNLELASCIREESGETAYRKECLEMFNSWFDKWFGET